MESTLSNHTPIFLAEFDVDIRSGPIEILFRGGGISTTTLHAKLQIFVMIFKVSLIHAWESSG